MLWSTPSSSSCFVRLGPTCLCSLNKYISEQNVFEFDCHIIYSSFICSQHEEKACECWFFFSHQYHVNLLVFWRVSWMNDMPWTISLMGSSRETNASFDCNFLFHSLDLKLEIVMQKYDVKNQNPYWRALQVETL